MSSSDEAAKKKQTMQNFLNRKRKMDMKVDEEVQKASTSSEKVEESEDSGNKTKEAKFDKAKKALLFEAKRAKERADQMGPQGYLKPTSLSTNKEFLRRTIESTMPRRKKRDDEK